MKLLFDQNISFPIIRKLFDTFPDCNHVSQVDLDNSEDMEIWAFARLHNYVIVTFDSDFYEISLIGGCPPKIIWIRTGNLTTVEITQLLVDNKNVIFDFINNSEQIDIACLELTFLYK
jgi:predicted nuclease of predicted toxin-antitoxin system